MTRVAVLMGGWSAEREVSLISGRAAAEALERQGFEVEPIDADRALPERLAAARPDVVFNALHGRYGEDGTVQGLLEIMGIPYTHSGVLASALAMDKALAKRLFESVGLRCPEGRVTSVEALARGHVAEPPYVVKPNREGSSVGVTIVRSAEERPLEQNDWPYGPEILVERYIDGRELTVAVLDDQPLEVTEIRPRRGFYDYYAKYTEAQADHLLPAELDPEVRRAALDQALVAHRALGCRGVSRADFRLADDDRTLYLLEVNTQPGMTPLSLVPEQAAHVGVSFDELVVRLVKAARCDG
ncbi:MAG: D-alanine--D-alanine ligase [Geminicoccaceae bacterium]|nr:D-alanine--D-alanine ligase [Geminicoccaceae bacterium]